MEHSDLGEPLNGFRYKFIEAEEYDAVLQILEKYLYKTYIPIGYDPKTVDDWNGFHAEMMKQPTNLSFIAVHIESGEIASCRMVFLVEKDAPSNFLSTMPLYFTHKSNMDQFKLFKDMGKDMDLFSRYNITRYADMFGLCVDEKYRYSGVAEQMYRRGLNFLQKRGIKIVKCSFITPYTRRAGYENGYQEFNRRYLHDCKNDEGEILNPDTDPTDFVCVGVFDLRDRQIK